MGISMELEEVPEKLIEYLSDAEDKLLLKIEKVKESLTHRIVEPGVVNDMQSVKRELGKFDQVLQDCTEVIVSYNGVMLQQKAAYLERQVQQDDTALETQIEGTDIDGA